MADCIEAEGESGTQLDGATSSDKASNQVSVGVIGGRGFTFANAAFLDALKIKDLTGSNRQSAGNN